MDASERSYLCWVAETTSPDRNIPAQLIKPAVKTGKTVDMILFFQLLLPKLNELKF